MIRRGSQKSQRTEADVHVKSIPDNESNPEQSIPGF